MKDIGKLIDDKLQMVYNYCEENDKSTGFMLQYMQDMAGVGLDDVLDFLKRKWSL